MDGEDRESRFKKEYKKGVDQEDGRRRRTETTVQIRKEKKEDQLAKRRNQTLASVSIYYLLFIIIYLLFIIIYLLLSYYSLAYHQNLIIKQVYLIQE